MSNINRVVWIVNEEKYQCLRRQISKIHVLIKNDIEINVTFIPFF